MVSKISIMENNVINQFSSTEVTNKISSWLDGWLERTQETHTVTLN